MTALADTIDPLSVLPGTALTPLGLRGFNGVGGKLSMAPEDFIVEEILPYSASGSGDHYFVQIRKSGLSTREAIQAFAQKYNLNTREIGYAGLKDRDAITTQWISLPTEPVSWSNDAIEILSVNRHQKKLKNGHVAGNRFTVFIDEVSMANDHQINEIIEQLSNGFPNYFGIQRFGGPTAKSLQRALYWVGHGCPRSKQAKFMTSVLQSAVFNLWLGARVVEPGLSIARLGDVLKKRETGGLFYCEEPEVDGLRLADGEIDPTGPLFGPKLKVAREEAREFEMQAESRLNLSEAQLKLLGRFGAGTRRVARVCPSELSFERVGARLKFSFCLPSGVYATVLLAEIMRPPTGYLLRQAQPTEG